MRACATERQKTDALSKLQTALARANHARDAEDDQRIRDAFDWWDLVFDGHFPAYG